MDITLEILIKIQDLEHMLEEIQSEDYKRLLRDNSKLTEEELDELIKKSKENLENEIKALEEELPADILKTYKRLKKKYGRAIVPVVNETCFNCFSHVPTSFLAAAGELITCPNCGIFLYMPVLTPNKDK